MVQALFSGAELPRYITHTKVVLIPKKENINKFLDHRPIGLSSFANKIFSKALHGKISPILPNVISKNQSGFIKKEYCKKYLLAQEIIRDINKRNQFINMVVKLDMTKPYDRVSWVFLIKVMEKFGFLERVIDTVWRLITNNWYIMLVNV